jgi:tetratricopeptide (TPR) repeat protein
MRPPRANTPCSPARRSPRFPHRRSSKAGSSTTPTSSKKRCSCSRAAIAEIDKSGAQPLADLHYYAGDALVRLERPAEAEYHLVQELRAFPQHVRARGALAALYHETGRDDEAARCWRRCFHVSPTPEAYSLAARLWTAFGNPSQAAAVRGRRRARSGRQAGRGDRDPVNHRGQCHRMATLAEHADAQRDSRS